MGARQPTAAHTVEQIARFVGGEVEGDRSAELVDVRGLADAGPEHLSFLANRRYYRQLQTTRAGAVLLDRTTDGGDRTVIRCDDPYVAFARAMQLFYPEPWPAPGIDPRAAVAADAEVEGTTIEAFVWIGPGARIGRGTWLEPGAYVGAGATVGEECRLMPNSVVYAGCRLGDRVWLNPGAVVGGEGFGFAPRREGHVKIPQPGPAVVEDDVEIGANSCIDRSTMGETRVRRGAKLDNLVQIGHGAEIGEHDLLAGYAGVAGSTRLGSHVILAAKAGVINHLEIGDGTQISTASIALQSHPAGSRLSGTPAIDHKRWLRVNAALEHLPDVLRRLRKLEKRLAELDPGDGE